MSSLNPMHEDCFFGQRHRAQRGDLEPIILRLLGEKPMHGYEIIRTLEERSHGFWRPSPGSVYPILQFLEEQDLVASREEQGKKVYAITDKGSLQVNTTLDKNQPSSLGAQVKAGLRFRDMRGFIHDSALLVREIAIHGSDDQVAAVKAIIKQTHDQLKAIKENIHV